LTVAFHTKRRGAADEREFASLPKSLEVVRKHPFGWQPTAKWNKLDFTEGAKLA